jgi:hypothetical protein
MMPLHSFPFALMNRDPDLRSTERISEQALSRPVPKARLDLPLALGEEENQAMHVLCARVAFLAWSS